MKNKFKHIKADESLLKSDVIVLTETWLEPDQIDHDYDFRNFYFSHMIKDKMKC